MSRRGTALFLAAALAAASCSRVESTTNASTAGSVSSRPLTLLKMNMTPALTYSAFFIARDEGYFEDEGLAVEFIPMHGDQVVMAATSGQLDVISMPIRPGIFNTILRGAALRIVADKGHSAPGPCIAEAFAAPPATADRIAKNGGSFRGERFVRQRADHTEYLIDRLLEKRGMTRDDIQYVDLSSSEYVTALQDRIDAILYTSEPRISNLTSKGLVRRILTAEDLDPGYQYSVVTFGKRLLRDEPELGHRFMRAYLRGVRQYNLGKTDRNVEIISKYTKFPPEIIRRSCWVAIANDGRVHPESLRGYMAWALRMGYLDAEVPPSMWWDGTYVDAANRAKDRTAP